MKISYNWLKDFVSFDIAVETLAESLSLAGFEVDSVETQRLDIPNVVIGKIHSVAKHPDADKLSVCTVDVNDGEPLTIICGAPNVAADQTVVVAKIGALLPVGLKIRKAKIRGVNSYGMICSEEELGLADKSDGIWVLPGELETGMPLAEALGYEPDYIMDIGVTPNRPDGLSHIGIAREVAAIANTRLSVPVPAVPETAVSASDSVSVQIDCPQTCPRYTARLIRNIRLGPSPDWMQRRLAAVGMRPINNVVDITNYVMLETGQPLHAFDYDTLSGGRIIVRESLQDEAFTTLDDKTHNLQQGTVLICDAEKPVALGGIMGGLNSEVGEATTNVLLEAAYFHPESIQSSLRHLGMHSEASMRFERGVDPNGVRHAQDRAVELLAGYADGEVDRGIVDVYPHSVTPVSIDFNSEKINRLLGTRLSRAEMAELLARIEIPVMDGQIVAPTFRPDLERVADIAEEVARIYGYDNILPETHTRLIYKSQDNPFDDFIDRMKDILTGVGLQEAVTNSLINAAEYQRLTGETIYTVLNPLNQDLDGLRNSLIPGLLSVLRYNVYRQQRNLAMFEISRVYHYPGSLSERPREENHLVIALTGQRESESWLSAKESYDFYDIKGLVEYLADKISLDKLAFIPYDNLFTETQSVKILNGQQELGFLGNIRSDIQRYYDIEDAIWVAQLNVAALFEAQGGAVAFREIPRYPYVERDFAVSVDIGIPAETMLSTIRKNGVKNLVNAYVFDVYEGKQVASGKKSIAFRLHFQSPEATLTEHDVNGEFNNILKAVEKAHGAKLRS